MKRLLTLAFAAALWGCGESTRTKSMATLQKETYPDFILDMHPAPDRDAIWSHRNGNLTLATFNGWGMDLKKFKVPGTEIGTSFKLFQGSEKGPVLLNENRGVSWLDLNSKQNLLPFCPTFEYSGDSHSEWLLAVDDKTALVSLVHDISGNPNGMPHDEDYHTEILRLTLPPKEKLPDNPDEGVSFDDVEHQIFNAGSRAYTFLGPKEILIRQPRLSAGPKMQYTTERWIAIDFNLKPTTHPLLDTLNRARDSAPAISKMAIAKLSPFALMGHDLETPRGQFFIASWKKQMSIEPIVLNSKIQNTVIHVLLAPDEKHFLVGTDDNDLFLGTIIETETGFSANVKQVHHFEGSYRLSWMGSSRGYVAGVWHNDETDLWIWWL
jgi:hypothetical protein